MIKNNNMFSALAEKNINSPHPSTIIIREDIAKSRKQFASHSSPAPMSKEVSSQEQYSFAFTPKTQENVLSNKKTKACENIIKTGHCWRNTECSYAHWQDEIVYQPCGFGDRCFRRMKKNLRDGQRICTFKHESETMEEYYIRTEMPIPNLPRREQRIPVSQLENCSRTQKTFSPQAEVFTPSRRESRSPIEEITIESSIENLEESILMSISQGFTKFNIKIN
jgi:hypothetical protein